MAENPRDLTVGKKRAEQYYDQEAKEYIAMYKPGYGKYPANLIRLNILIERLKQLKFKSVLDAGCGTAGPMIRLLKEGFSLKGFDFSEEMVRVGAEELKKAGYAEDLIFKGDLEDDRMHLQEQYDAAIAFGVFPHIVDEEKALLNLKTMIKKEGRVFIEFRNDLFSAFTLNEYSLDFFLNRVIDRASLPEELAREAVQFYSEKLGVEMPEQKENGRIAYTDILAKFRNPLSVAKELFEPCGFSVVKLHFYHYHALPPVFEKKNPELFHELSLKLENSENWRGYLMASAFIVEAKLND